IDRNEDQIALAGEMLGGGLQHLFGARKMNVSVGVVDRRAAEHAVALRLLPQGARADFVDQAHESMVMDRRLWGGRSWAEGHGPRFHGSEGRPPGVIVAGSLTPTAEIVAIFRENVRKNPRIAFGAPQLFAGTVMGCRSRSSLKPGGVMFQERRQSPRLAFNRY